MKVLRIPHIELEMTFPDQYPFEPPFCYVTKPAFQRRTGHVMNGAICMELLTNQGWNPINDIETVIVSIRSMMIEGGGRLQGVAGMNQSRYNELLQSADQVDDDEKKRNIAHMNRVYTASQARSSLQTLTDTHTRDGWIEGKQG